jgi:hypothetical protein
MAVEPTDPDKVLWMAQRKARKVIRTAKQRGLDALRELPKQKHVRKRAVQTAARLRSALVLTQNRLKTARMGKGPNGTHFPTPALRNLVMSFRATGMTMHDIGKLLGISGQTVKQYYAAELECGELEANYLVANTLFKIATDTDHPGVVPAARRWLEVRAVGWNPSHKIEQVTPSNEAPVIDSKKLTPEERLQLAELMERIIARESTATEEPPAGLAQAALPAPE